MNIRGFKFLVEATIINVSISVQFSCKIQVILKRGSSKLETQPTYELHKGLAIINESLNFSISASLGLDGKFEEKKTQIIVILVTEKGQKNAGMHNLNISQYLNQQQFGMRMFYKNYQNFKKPCHQKNVQIKMQKLQSTLKLNKQEKQIKNWKLQTSQLICHRFQHIRQTKYSRNTAIKYNKIILDLKKQDSELNLQIQKLKQKVNEMIEKEHHQEIVLNYEQQLQELNAKLKTVYNENTMIQAQLTAKSSVIDQQNQEVAQLKSKLSEYEFEFQEKCKSQSITLNQKNIELQNQVIELNQQINNLNSTIQEMKNNSKEFCNQNENNQIDQLNQLIENLQNQIKDKNEHIQNLKNLTSGTIIALQQRNETLEKRLNEQKDIVEKLKNADYTIKATSSNDSSILVEELQSALSIKKQDIENLQLKYEQQLAKKEEIVQNLQQKLEESMRKELDISKTSQDSKNQVVNKSVRQIQSRTTNGQAKKSSPILTIQMGKQSKVQQMQRQIADTSSFIDDQKELPDQLLSLKRTIQSKLQSYQQAQISLEQKVQQLQQELEMCQQKLKQEQSQQCSESQFQEQTHTSSEEIQKITSALEQKTQELLFLQQQFEQQKQSGLDLSKQLEETKSQLNTVKQNLLKSKQQLAETLQEKVLLQAKMTEQQKSIKEKNSEIQKGQELIAELEQYNIQMEETISQTLEQYKLQHQQIKQSYEKEKKWRQELQEQIKALKEELSKFQQGIGNDVSDKQQQCQCKEQLQQNQYYIDELQQQIAELQLLKLEQGIQKNRESLIKTSVQASRRESLAYLQYDDLNKKEETNAIQKSINSNEIGLFKELEEQIHRLTNEKIKVSRDYQNELERVLMANEELEKKCTMLLFELEHSKITIGEIFNAAIEIGGTPLVDQLQIAFGIKE
ncbi:unnamed protein product (macronuclear) [Paramecium tetraurelia]|uniref:C2 NT-type domain-containing protein n=1 Tax=Paramecium tetraurelia TaxID=5888 RepID=A0DWN9_PARTE|nr:uncharacterized protein GSPATT00021099001 [Paramecium tetraurelia]CAK87456.1 unnamed protein product [Paramecium tetraurelia]|eukprot:XP_001454853.1 hypothetical protein (macronuclear) [Paramecium tetraurelia strain d4-2]